MAGVLISELQEQLASITLPQEVKLVVGVKNEVSKLSSNLQTIQDVLEDAERRQLTEATVKQWLAKLKDVSYDIDNVLDEWNTAILKMQIEGDANAPQPKGKVCSFIHSSFYYRQVALLDNFAMKIKDLNERLDDIVNEKRNPDLEPKTVSIVDVSVVHGRDQDKEKLVDMLLSESSQGPPLRIISIVGMGGIGKTTLAQLVYNDDNVKAHFQKTMWVFVSDPFDEIKIAKAILEALTGSTPNLNELDSLLHQINHSIKGNKFLLVLDDVWNEDSTKWELLKNSLLSSSPGSRILVTTRKENVAIIMGTTKIFPLGQLSKEECWSLLSQVAFSGRNKEECEKLEDIGRKIVDKCKGLPLAAKTLGSLLLFKKTREQWQRVLNSEVWKLEEVEKGFFPPLLLSYYDLSSTMRRCFLYCAIFPKDYLLEKDRLINLWMAQGYLRATGGKDMEMVGEECFKNLAMRSFFQNFYRDENGSIISCKMHDIVYDFAQFLTENECFVMEVNDSKESMLSHVKAHHSMLILAERVSIPESICNLKNLRSLIVEYKKPQLTSAALSKVFNQLTFLRTLEFVNCDYYGFSLMELPKEIGKLIHLRYLNLTNNSELENLPETISELCNLQILNVSRCRGLRNLPHGLGKLINLQTLNVSWCHGLRNLPHGLENLTNLQTLNVFGCHGLRKLPHGLGKLINLRYLKIVLSGVSFMPKGVEGWTSLRTLDTFYVSSADNDFKASTLKDLGNLNQLGGHLEIRGLGEVRDVDEAKKAQLDKKNLLGLDLNFGWENLDEQVRKENDKQVLDALQPSPNLEELSIVEYRSTKFPNWMMSLAKLRKVQICKCKNCDFLPPLGKLLFLESLFIGFVKTKNLDAEGGMGRVKRVGIEFLGIETVVNKNEGPSLSSVTAFPKLKDLCFQCMFEWEEWDYGVERRMKEGEDITTASTPEIMPCLQFLKIRFCPKLKALPDCLLDTKSLEVLEISFCPILEERYYRKSEGEDWHRISHIPNIIINYNYVQKDGRMVSTDATEPQSKEMSNHLLHSRSLKVLDISFCPILEERYYKNRKGEEWSNISHIPDIRINYNYVQRGGQPQLPEESSSDSD